MKSLSRVRLLATPWTAAYQAPLSMGFSRQEYWSGVPLPSPAASSNVLLNLSSYNLLFHQDFVLTWATQIKQAYSGVLGTRTRTPGEPSLDLLNPV